ncbi:MAG: translation initiation factor IF-2 [Chloroflexi bacterium]|nr:translation initiation factor IF-2 [Chloroflexota bacterium]MBU1747034.1 translation initiation factor IF-2 [Chloroflexota bacterium]
MGVIEVGDVISVKELAGLMNLSPVDVIKRLIENGVMANINQNIDFDTAAVVAADLGFEAQEKYVEAPPATDTALAPLPSLPRHRRRASLMDQDKLVSRPAVVTVMGHVDHGKTKLLDAIRQARVADQEVGGITQHIGAYQVEKAGKRVTFLDTPGHEAFTAMRARGAQVTDIAVLVVAADDGVMPQTVEAINHARAAQVPIIVALNKIDKDNANPDRVKQQLSDVGLLVEDWGGDIICVPISAKFLRGIDDLLEMILLVAEMADLKANPNQAAEGTIIESRMDRARGAVATALIHNGTLRVGDYVVVEDTYGKVRALFNDQGKRIRRATPATPVEILGLPNVVRAGDTLEVVAKERDARERASQRREQTQEAAQVVTARRPSLEDLLAQAEAGAIKELNLVIKADVQGSLEPIVSSLQDLGTEMLKVNVIHQGTGNITESDVMLASASGAVVIGFTVSADAAAQRLAEADEVEIRTYDIIYRLIEDVDKALHGLLEPTFVDVIDGHATVRAVFRVGKDVVAGSYVDDGVVLRKSRARVYRDDKLLHEGSVTSLKRFKDDVREVKTGFECGVAVAGFRDFEEGDRIEFYHQEKEQAAT